MLPASVGVTVFPCLCQEPKQQAAAAAPKADATDPDQVSERPAQRGPAHPAAADSHDGQTLPSSEDGGDVGGDGGGPRGNPGFTADVVQ